MRQHNGFTKIDVLLGNILLTGLVKSPDRKIVYGFLKKFFAVKAIRTAFWDGLKENQKKVEEKPINGTKKA